VFVARFVVATSDRSEAAAARLEGFIQRVRLHLEDELGRHHRLDEQTRRVRKIIGEREEPEQS
jgi:hypothetical protein